MPKKKNDSLQKPPMGAIVEAMAQKMAKQPVVLDFSKLKGAFCDAFVICHGTSRTQVEAIASHVVDEVKKKTGIGPWHKEGFENAEWILIDYGNIVVHIFQEERRKFFNLEQLWSDPEISGISLPG